VIGLPVGGGLGFGLLLRALAALMIGRLESLPAVLGASVALGMLHQGIDWNQDTSLVGDAIMALVIIVALLARRIRKERGELELGSFQSVGEIRRLPKALSRLPEILVLRFGATIGIAAFLLWLPRWMDTTNTLRASYLHLVIMVVVSLVVLTGWAGQLSLGQWAFVSIGAVVGAELTQEWGVDLILATLGAGVAGVVASLAVGLPALRLRGLYLAVTSLAFVVATTSYVLNPRFFDWLPSGRIERFPIAGRIDWTSSFAMYHVSLVAMALTFVAVAGIRSSRTGRVLIAMRENESAAEAYGVDATRAKLTAFSISGFIAAAAGALIVHHQQAFVVGGEAQASIGLFIAGVTGGLGSMLGASIGALNWWGGRWWLPDNFRLLSTGIGVLIVLLVLPGGLAGGLYQLRDAGLRRLAERRGIDAPGITPDRLEASEQGASP
jgi:branched-chain amino acid transport system permease protein